MNGNRKKHLAVECASLKSFSPAARWLCCFLTFYHPAIELTTRSEVMVCYTRTRHRNNCGDVRSTLCEQEQLFDGFLESVRDTRWFHIALFLFELTSNISQHVFRAMPAMCIAAGLAGYHRFCVCACVCGDQ